MGYKSTIIVLGLLSLQPVAEHAQAQGLPLTTDMVTSTVVQEPIALNVYVPENSGVDIQSVNALQVKLAEAVNAAGFSSNDPDARFVIVPRMEYHSVTATPTVPAKTVVDGKLHLYIGDGVSSVLFASESFVTKGVGADTEQAQKNAVSRLDPGSEQIQSFIRRGRAQISAYYDAAYPKLLKDAETAFARQDYQEAFNILYSIPGSCTGYAEAMDKVVAFDREIRNRDNEALLASARAAWSAQPDQWGAERAMELIGQIDPTTTAFAGAEALCNEIKARLKEVDDRQWRRKVEQEQAENQRQLAKIQADKEVALADRRLRQQREAKASAERVARINADSAARVARANANVAQNERDYNLRMAELSAAREIAREYARTNTNVGTIRNVSGWW